MKHILIIFVVTFFSSFIFSCNIKIKETDVETEDLFLAIVLSPNDDVKKTIVDNLSSYILNRLDYYGDTWCIDIVCDAIWDTSRNNDPFLIKINEIDTSLFLLTINEGEYAETLMDWRNGKDRPILQTIKAILDTGSFSLSSLNYDDISPRSILNSYFDSVVTTPINLTMCLSNW